MTAGILKRVFEQSGIPSQLYCTSVLLCLSPTVPQFYWTPLYCTSVLLDLIILYLSSTGPQFFWTSVILNLSNTVPQCRSLAMFLSALRHPAQLGGQEAMLAAAAALAPRRAGAPM